MLSDLQVLKRIDPVDVEMARMMRNALQARISRRLSPSKIIQFQPRKETSRITAGVDYAADLKVSQFNCRAA